MVIKQMKKLTTDIFIKRAKEVHGDTYDYSESLYNGYDNKLKIICVKHGIFNQAPSNHLSGKGCEKCANESRGKNSQYSNEEIIKIFDKIHGKKYDYNLVEYNGIFKKIKIICKVHGEFEQTAKSHVNGNGCKKCSKRYQYKNDEFIKKCIDKHGNEYDYCKTDYKNMKDKIEIICKKHGSFFQVAEGHLNGSGCFKCYGTPKNTKEYIIEKFINTHGNYYDYSNVIYKKFNEKVIIICKKHGEFKQKPGHHIDGAGCPICKESKGERFIRDLLINNKIYFIPQYTFSECIGKRRKLPFDFYIPKHNLCIEYDGEQHYKSIPYFGGEEKFLENQRTDGIKTNFCKENGIKIIRIRYDMKKEEILKLLSFLFFHE